MVLSLVSVGEDDHVGLDVVEGEDEAEVVGDSLNDMWEIFEEREGDTERVRLPLLWLRVGDTVVDGLAVELGEADSVFDGLECVALVDILTALLDENVVVEETLLTLYVWACVLD